MRYVFLTAALVLSASAFACSGSDGASPSIDGTHADADAGGGDDTSVLDAGAFDATPPARDASPPKPDAGKFAIAPHPAMPQVVNYGGPLITSPVFTSITFPGYDLTSDADAFLAGVGETSYWHAAVGEYGVGKPSVQAPIHLAEQAPTSIDDAAVQTWLAGKLDGTHPEFGTPSANSLYVVYYPASTTITLMGMTSCQAFGGYHNSVHLSSGVDVAYAVVPECSFGDSTLYAVTAGTSHELIEAVTDAFPLTTTPGPAYTGADDDDAIWELALGGGEVGDMCAQFQSSFVTPAGFPYTVQRTWSNSNAAASKDPCVPVPAGEIYFAAVGVLKDTVTISSQGQSGQTRGVMIPVGQSKSIEVDLFSEAPTSAWTVSATDMSQQGLLGFSWDETSGKNGDKLHLTITVNGADSNFGGDAFSIDSTNGSETHSWIGFVGQN